MESNLNASSAGAERLADLLMLSHEPMLVWRLDGPIEFWNAGAERLYGFSANEAIGRCSHTLLQTKFPVEFTDLRSQLDNRGYWSGELRHTCKDGREVVVDSRMQLLADGTVLEVNRDVTQVKALAAGQAMLLRELSAAAVKFEAIFQSSRHFRWHHGPAGPFAGGERPVIGVVRLHPFSNSSATKKWQFDRDFADRLSAQKCRRQDCRRIESREGYHRTQTR